LVDIFEFREHVLNAVVVSFMLQDGDLDVTVKNLRVAIRIDVQPYDENDRRSSRD
jgi:hypothetical protein